MESPNPQTPMEGWLAGCACRPARIEHAGDANAGGPVRLTSDQRRDLVRLGTAAIVSTAIAVAPALYVQESQLPALAASPIAIASTRLPAPRATELPAAEWRADRARRTRPARALAAIAVAPASGARLMTASLAESVSPEAALPPVPAGRPTGNALVRALVGSGRYKVSPFPQPAGGN